MKKVTLILSYLFPFALFATSISNLQKAYPDFIQAVSATEIIWFDGTHMPLYDEKLDKTKQEKLYNPSLNTIKSAM